MSNGPQCPHPGYIHRVYDREGMELGYGVLYEDVELGRMWEVHVPSPRGRDMVLGSEDTLTDVEMAIREWHGDE